MVCVCVVVGDGAWWWGMQRGGGRALTVHCVLKGAPLPSCVSCAVPCCGAVPLFSALLCPDMPCGLGCAVICPLFFAVPCAGRVARCELMCPAVQCEVG